MKRVLIVDDSKIMSNYIRSLMESHGFEVVGQASSGDRGVALYKDLHPDLVTMDIMMPEMDGIEALKKIRAFDPKANVIMVTAMDSEAIIKEAFEAGAKGFHVKPFDSAKLIQELEMLSDKIKVNSCA